MNNNIIQLKIMQRLNKLASQDYDNLECWQMVESFNKAQVMWCRRQLHGTNVKQEGDEQSKIRIDDLQILLKDKSVKFSHFDVYDRTSKLPEDYLEWKRISCKAKDECCDNLMPMVVYLTEEANVDILLRDKNKKPDFNWGETFCTLKDNYAHVYTNGEFSLQEGVLTYYRQPINIQVKDCVDPYTQETSTVDVECEFKDDIIELIIDEAVKIIAGDIESMNQRQTASNEVEKNN